MAAISRKFFHVAKARDEFLDGLYELLEGAIRYLRVLSNDSGEIKCLFVAHPSYIAFARRYPYILMIDCTYKTNRHMMPMLNIFGITATFSTLD